MPKMATAQGIAQPETRWRYVSISWYEGLYVGEGVWKEGMKKEKEEKWCDFTRE